jgi:hypothetical protein
MLRPLPLITSPSLTRLATALRLHSDTPLFIFLYTTLEITISPLDMLFLFILRFIAHLSDTTTRHDCTHIYNIPPYHGSLDSILDT